MPCDDPFVRHWAGHCASFDPEFLDQDAVATVETSVAVISRISSACNALDHHFETGSYDSAPLMMRVVVSASRKNRGSDGRKWNPRKDFACQHLGPRIIFRPTVQMKQATASYEITHPELNSPGREFFDSLRMTDRDLPVMRYVPLDAMASNIQF